MESNFFTANSYFIDQKVNYFKFANGYTIFNEKGDKVGFVQQKLSFGQKVLRLLLNKAMLPFLLEIKDDKNVVQASVSRGWTFFMSKIIIKDQKGAEIGTIQQKFKLFKPTFNILDRSERIIATISGDWKGWNFEIKDQQEKPIGAINKKWAGAMKEVFTTADKYNVTISPEYTQSNNKILILSTAITIDMVMKNGK